MNKAADEYIVEDELSKAIESIEQQEDAYSKNIMGYTETAFMDDIYEEYVAFLTNLRERLRFVKNMLKG